jgi:hypothetical protein
MSYRFAYSLRAGPGGNWSSILILLASCQQTYMTYTIAVRTEKNSWWWTEELSETCRVSFQNKFEKLVHLVGFIIKNLSRCTVTWTSNWPVIRTVVSLETSFIQTLCRTQYLYFTNHYDFYLRLILSNINMRWNTHVLRFIPKFDFKQIKLNEIHTR